MAAASLALAHCAAFALRSIRIALIFSALCTALLDSWRDAGASDSLMCDALILVYPMSHNSDILDNRNALRFVLNLLMFLFRILSVVLADIIFFTYLCIAIYSKRPKWANKLGLWTLKFCFVGVWVYFLRK